MNENENEKALAMFNFIDAYINLRETKITDIAKEPWHKFLKDIPKYDGINLYYQKKQAPDIKEEDTLLSVQRQTMTNCPMPDQYFSNWLEDGWDRFDKEVEYKEFMQENGQSSDLIGTPASFEDNHIRVELYDDWLKKRTLWAAKEKEKAIVNSLYTALRDIDREISEENKNELMVADGFLVSEATNDDGEVLKVAYPILSKKVQIKFDGKTNSVIVSEMDSIIELYMSMFESLNFDIGPRSI